MESGLTIQQVAAVTGVTEHTLRYYEKAGLLEPISRGIGGHRRYRPEDVGRVEFLTKLRRTGMGIREVRNYVEALRRGEATLEYRKALLEAHREAVRAQMAEMQRCLDAIEKKIALYGEQACLMPVPEPATNRKEEKV